MSYKIIGDSCLDLTEAMKKDSHFQMIPLTLQVDDVQVIDDETFDQKEFLRLVKASPNCPKTACPSPETFKKAYECDADDIYVITLSSHLSGTYNSAVVGKSLYEEEHGQKNIKIMDSWSASAGELNIALYIAKLCESGMEYEEVCAKAEAFKKEMKTYFVLESLDALRKNGRLTGLQAFFATTLNIKPVMGAVEGVIIKEDQARGVNKALAKMCDYAKKNIKNPEEKIGVVAHCNNRERAEFVKEELLKRVPFKDVVITETAGVSTVYASDGGVILAC
ncbi:MAG: DegV family protein [Hungatella sp.]|nr:DegV family protein [Hungatella sp.]